jgi:hypothetical protein
MDVAGVDAAGAAMGSAGLVAFAAICRLSLPRYPAGLVLAGATLGWSFTAGSIWFLHKRCKRRF